MSRLQEHLRSNRIMDPSQGAFQPNKASIDQVAYLCQRIQDNFNSKLSTIVVFIDFKAAYDLVCRNILIQKLIAMNTPIDLVCSIRDFLCQRFILVRCQDRTSSFKQIKRGLPQGAVSSTTLFNCMLNDLCVLLNSIPGVEVIVFADDIAIVVSGDVISIMESIMNRALENLFFWVKSNEMVVNMEKRITSASVCEMTVENSSYSTTTKKSRRQLNNAI